MMESLTWDEYQKMWKIINDFKTKKGRLPHYVTFKGQKITKKEYQNMEQRVEDFKEKYKRNPGTIKIREVIKISKHPDLIQMEKKWGLTVNTATDLFNALNKHARYSYYYNDQYSNTIALKRILAGQGINCTDYCQLLKPILESLGYKVAIEHVKVQCIDGNWYGHYLLRITGGLKKVENLIFDAVSTTKTGYKLGQACCTRGFKHLGWGID